MSNDSKTEHRGWTGREVEVPGVHSRIYTHAGYPDRQIYVNHPHGFAATYDQNGTKLQNHDSLSSAIEAVESESGRGVEWTVKS